MELPFTIVFEPPSRSELRALLRMRGPWVAGLIVALTIGAAYLLSNVARADARATADMVPLQVTSVPVGARVWLDGRQSGVTPVGFSVEPGSHSVALKASGAMDGDYTLDVGTGGRAFDAVLWRRTPDVTHLRPTLPGATLSDVRLLQSGELGLAVTLPPGRQIEAWSLDPWTGAVRQDMDAAPGARLAFAADGRHLAFLGPDVGPPAPTDRNTPYGSPPAADQLSAAQSQPIEQKVVWLVDARDGPSAASTGWRAPLEPSEHLADVSWSPRADRLLVVASQPLPGGAKQSRVWFVTADGQHADPALTLPSDLAPGTAAWSPDGTHVAFVAHAGQLNALCLLGVDGSFRYLGDLDPSSDLLPGYPPVSWSADGQRVAFVAPQQRPPGLAFDWLAPPTQHAVYVAAMDQAAPSPLPETSLDTVSWRPDGQLLGLWRAGPDAPLGIRLLSDTGQRNQDLAQLPLKVGTTYSSTWDQDHAEILVSSTSPDTTATRDYWLVRLGMQDQP